LLATSYDAFVLKTRGFNVRAHDVFLAMCARPSRMVPPLVVTAAEVGAYTRPLSTSTQAVLVSEPFCVQFVKYLSYNPSTLLHAAETTRRLTKRCLR